jgi:hypothetical protein
MRISSFKIAIFFIKCLALLGFALPLYAGVQQYTCAKYLSHSTASISGDENTTPDTSAPCAPFFHAVLPTIGIIALPLFCLTTNLRNKGFTLKRYLVTHSGNDPPALTTTLFS